MRFHDLPTGQQHFVRWLDVICFIVFGVIT
jgi:hypothetical protein